MNVKQTKKRKEQQEALRFLLELWKAGEASGVGGQATCEAFLLGGREAVENLLEAPADDVKL